MSQTCTLIKKLDFYSELKGFLFQFLSVKKVFYPCSPVLFVKGNHVGWSHAATSPFFAGLKIVTAPYFPGVQPSWSTLTPQAHHSHPSAVPGAKLNISPKLALYLSPVTGQQRAQLKMEIHHYVHPWIHLSSLIEDSQICFFNSSRSYSPNNKKGTYISDNFFKKVLCLVTACSHNRHFAWLRF